MAGTIAGGAASLIAFVVYESRTAMPMLPLRLFTNRSKAKDEKVLLILIKPKIIIQREAEQQQFPLLTHAEGT